VLWSRGCFGEGIKAWDGGLEVGAGRWVVEGECGWLMGIGVEAGVVDGGWWEAI